MNSVNAFVAFVYRATQYTTETFYRFTYSTQFNFKRKLKKISQIQMELLRVACLSVKKIVRIALLSRNLFQKQVIAACRH